MTAYYNENDPKAAAWLRELIEQGLIAAGDVDERSITDVRPNDLVGYTQCHFFAGVGGWSIASRLAGWADDREIWSASCPCQPFSVAGKGAGVADERHLWPYFFDLARARRPSLIVGEQVAAAVGKDWFLGVRSDMEGIGYVVRGVVVPACAVNAPHRRDRLWFIGGSSVLGDVHDTRSQGHTGDESGEAGWQEPNRPAAATGRCSPGVPRCDVADTNGGYSSSEREQRGRQQRQQQEDGRDCTRNPGCNVADSYRGGRIQGIDNSATGHGNSIATTSGPGSWDSARWLVGHDGKARRVEPDISMLVDGIPARAPLLRGYGNAIVPQVAAEMIGAWMDCEGSLA